MTSSGTQPSRALLIAAGTLTQLLGAVCLVLALVSLPIAHDLKSGMSGVIASAVASLAAIVCGTLVWRGRLVPLALSIGLAVGLGIGLARGGSAVGALVRILPAGDLALAKTLTVVGAVVLFVAAVLCVLAIPAALALRQWARAEIAKARNSTGSHGVIDDAAPTGERPRLERPSARALPTRPSASTLATRPSSSALPERPRLERPSASTLPARPSSSAVPERLSPDGTLKGFGAAKLMPTQVIRVDAPARHTPLVIAGVAVTLIAIGIVLITATTGDGEAPATATGSGSSVTKTTTPDEPVPPAVPAVAPAAASDAGALPPASPPLDDLVARLHGALASPAAAELSALFEPRAFAFGVESHDLAEGRDAIVAQLREDLGEPPAKGFEVAARFTHVASDGDVGWLAEELTVGEKTFVITAAASLRDNAWTIGALHWAQAMPNEMAYRLAREGELGVPDAIPDAHESSPLATAMRTAFSSRPSFVEARSTRADAFNFGSAPGERLKGGEPIQKVFGRLRSTIRLHDAVKVGMLGERGGWGVANADFTDTDKDGTEVTQTFRVLAVWLREDAGWRIVQTQWSNPR